MKAKIAPIMLLVEGENYEKEDYAEKSHRLWTDNFTAVYVYI